MAGNDDLSRPVQVRRADDLALSRVEAGLGDLVSVQAQDGRHRARSKRHRFLHVASASPNDPQRVGKRHRTSRHVGGVLAQAVASNESRSESTGLEQTMRRHADGKNRRLRVLGQQQLVFRSFEAQSAKTIAQRIVCFRERFATDRERIGQCLAHANFLGPLSRELEGNQWWDTAEAAISRSIRSIKLFAANRYAMATAFRTARALDLPWPTTVTPVMPSNAAPPYSD